MAPKVVPELLAWKIRAADGERRAAAAAVQLAQKQMALASELLVRLRNEAGVLPNEEVLIVEHPQLPLGTVLKPMGNGEFQVVEADAEVAKP